jgi:hypothetical protein
MPTPGHLCGFSLIHSGFRGWGAALALDPHKSERPFSRRPRIPIIMNTSAPNNRSKAAWVFAPLALALTFAACDRAPSESELAARAEADRLKSELQARDSLIGEMTLSFDDIEKNIALMDERGRLLGENAEGDLNVDKRQKIVRDLQLMNGLLQESRDRIAELNKRLDKSNIEASGLRNKLKELDRMLAARDSSIANLKDELLARDFKIEQVNEQLTAIELEMAKREAIIEQQTEQLNKAWYAVGTAKELEERGLVTKTGGFIGLGKQSTLSEAATAAQFKEVDVREVTRVPLQGRKAKMVTDHPRNSYSIVENGNELAYIEIKDPDAFWRLSKYMVVEVK